MVLSVDHIGVRRVQFVESESDTSPDGSPWYEVLDVERSVKKVDLRCDSLFVRGFRTLPDNSTWKSPRMPKFNQWNILRDQEDTRLHLSKLDANIRGLLFCSRHGSPIGIHGFSGVTKNFDNFASLMEQSLGSERNIWVHFPLNAGEAINTAWVRKYATIRMPDADSVLAIRTSFGRPYSEPIVQSDLGIRMCSVPWSKKVMAAFREFSMTHLIQTSRILPYMGSPQTTKDMQKPQNP